jgi:hypothetical protein
MLKEDSAGGGASGRAVDERRLFYENVGYGRIFVKKYMGGFFQAGAEGRASR